MSEGKDVKDETAQKEPPSALESMWSLWTKWLKRAGLASTLFGTFIALLYFYKIDHMPVDSLSSLAGLSTAIAFVSVGGLGVLTALWGIPGLLMHFGFREFPREGALMFERRGASQPERKDAPAADSTAVASTGSSVTEPDDVPPSAWRAFAWSFGTLGLPWLALLARAAPDSFAGCERAWLVPLLAAAFGFLLTLGVIFGIDPRHPKAWWPSIRAAWPSQRKLLLPAAFYVFVSILAIWAFVPVAGFHSGSGVKGFFFEVVICIATAVFLNALAIAMSFGARNSTPDRRAIVLPLYVGLVTGTLVAMLSIFSAWEAAHEWVMVRANVRIPRVNLTLEKAACDALPSRLVQVLAKRATSDPDTCVVRDALVMSAVGSRWLIAVPRSGCGRYIIKSDHVQLAEVPEVRKRVASNAACPAQKPAAAPPVDPAVSNCVF